MMRRTGLVVLGLLVALVMMPTRLIAQAIIFDRNPYIREKPDRDSYIREKEEEIAAYRKAIELDPKDANAYFNLGNALIELAHEYAQPYFPRCATKNDRIRVLDDNLIMPISESLVNQDQKTICTWNLGNALHVTNDFERSIRNLYFRKKREEAIAAYRKAIELDPKYTNAYNSLGDALDNLGKREEAITVFRKAIELDPNDAVAHNRLGLLYQQQGELEEALAEYEAALKIDPKYKYAKNNRDKVLALLKQPTELAYTDNRYLRPDDPLTRPKRAVVFLTALFPQGRDKDKKGTGFIIKRTGNKLWIITNRHILLEKSNGRTCDSVEIQLYVGDKPSNARIKTLQSKTILTAEKIDLALIEIEVPNLPDDIQALSLAIPQDNQKISTIGHPDRNPWQSDQGKVIDVSDEELLLRISNAIGSSGSPVMDENYGVVGIITNVGDKQMGFGIPISQITKQIAIWGIKLP